jgi:hypothetical protein
MQAPKLSFQIRENGAAAVQLAVVPILLCASIVSNLRMRPGTSLVKGVIFGLDYDVQFGPTSS